MRSVVFGKADYGFYTYKAKGYFEIRVSYNEDLCQRSTLILNLDGLDLGRDLKCSVMTGTPAKYAWAVKSCKKINTNIELRFSKTI